MRKEYVSPELETVKLITTNIIMTSILESSIPEVIGGDKGEESGEINI